MFRGEIEKMNKNIPRVIVGIVIVFGFLAVLSALTPTAIDKNETISKTEPTISVQEKTQYSQQQCDVLITMLRGLETNHSGIKDSLLDTIAFTPNDKAMIDSIERTIITSAKGIEDYKITIAERCN